MKVPGNFILIGLMGAGKTTVGRAIARLADKEFYDSDHEIEFRTGVRIPTIFEIEGEQGFRAREAEVILALLAQDDIVLATGGGAVLNPVTRAALSRGGMVIYLRASAEELYQRTRHDKNRPLLQTEDPKARLQELHQVRDPIYREIAHLVVETGRQAVSLLAQQILNDISDYHAKHPR